mgnify:CR=1 FL=1
MHRPTPKQGTIVHPLQPSNRIVSDRTKFSSSENVTRRNKPNARGWKTSTKKSKKKRPNLPWSQNRNWKEIGTWLSKTDSSKWKERKKWGSAHSKKRSEDASKNGSRKKLWHRIRSWMSNASSENLKMQGSKLFKIELRFNSAFRMRKKVSTETLKINIAPNHPKAYHNRICNNNKILKSWRSRGNFKNWKMHVSKHTLTEKRSKLESKMIRIRRIEIVN